MSPRFALDVHAIMSGRDTRVRARVLRGMTALAEPGYRLAVAVRNQAFDRRFRRVNRLPAPTISVGNITAGGTGKTPMVADLVQRLGRMGQQPAVLMRGYMQQSGQPSDEQRVLSDLLGCQGVAIVCHADRTAGAALALKQQPGTSVFMLDDGFQHRRVHRDLDLVLIDATEPFGLGHLLPRGLLREPMGNLARAHGVIVTRADQGEDLAALSRRIEQVHGQPPIAATAHVWEDFRVGLGDRVASLDALRDWPVAVVLGIGNPAAFCQTAAARCGSILLKQINRDHHIYTSRQLAELMQQAQAAGARAILTTEKDWVKWRPILQAAKWPVMLPVYRPRLGLHWQWGSQAVDDLLRQAVAGPAHLR